MEVWPGLPSGMPADREMVWQRHALSRERLEAESFSTSMCFGCFDCWRECGAAMYVCKQIFRETEV